MPRRSLADHCMGFALRLGYALESEGQRPHQGQSPNLSRPSPAGHSHRLTSGGKAELPASRDF